MNYLTNSCKSSTIFFFFRKRPSCNCLVMLCAHDLIKVEIELKVIPHNLHLPVAGCAVGEDFSSTLWQCESCFFPLIIRRFSRSCHLFLSFIAFSLASLRFSLSKSLLLFVKRTVLSRALPCLSVLLPLILPWMWLVKDYCSCRVASDLRGPCYATTSLLKFVCLKCGWLNELHPSLQEWTNHRVSCRDMRFGNTMIE